MIKRILVTGDEVYEKEAKAALLDRGYCVRSQLNDKYEYVASVLNYDGICLCGEYAKFQGAVVAKQVAGFLGKDIFYFNGNLTTEATLFDHIAAEIILAIESVTGIPKAEFVSKRRDLILVYCRMIFAYFMNKQGVMDSIIAEYLGITRRRVNALRTNVDTECKYNPAFREMYDKVWEELTREDYE
jgi:hypothetical protein